MSSGRQSVIAYVCFAALALAAVLILSQMNVPYPHPSQAESLRWEVLGPILLVGCLGAWLFGWLMVKPGAERLSWRSLVGMSLTLGMGLGLLAVVLDATLGLSRTIATELGVTGIHLPWPYSTLAYMAGAVVVESLYRIIPIPILLLLVSRLLLRGRGLEPTFWIVAILTSLLEPLSQAALLAKYPSLMLGIGSFVFVVNMTGAWLLRRYGVAAPLLMRIALYAVWHITLGPML